MAVMVGLLAKILITTIQAEFILPLHVSLQFSTKFTWIIVIIKIFAISLLSWVSHLFSQWPSWEPHTFFTAGLFLD